MGACCGAGASRPASLTCSGRVGRVALRISMAKSGVFKSIPAFPGFKAPESIPGPGCGAAGAGGAGGRARPEMGRYPPRGGGGRPRRRPGGPHSPRGKGGAINTPSDKGAFIARFAMNTLDLGCRKTGLFWGVERLFS